MLCIFLYAQRMGRHIAWHLADMPCHIVWQCPADRVWQHIGPTLPTFSRHVGILAANMSHGGSGDTTRCQHFPLQFCCLNITSNFSKPSWIQYEFTFVRISENLIQGGFNKLYVFHSACVLWQPIFYLLTLILILQALCAISIHWCWELLRHQIIVVTAWLVLSMVVCCNCSHNNCIRLCYFYLAFFHPLLIGCIDCIYWLLSFMSITDHFDLTKGQLLL